MTTEWRLRTCGAEDLDLVGPLRVAVHHWHAETMPQLGPYVSDDRNQARAEGAVRGVIG